VTAIDLRLATPEELPLVMAIIGEAAAWLANKGIDQWSSPPNIHWQRRMAAAIEHGDVYTAGIDKESFCHRTPNPVRSLLAR